MDKMPMKLYFDRNAPRIWQRSGYTTIELVVVIALIAIMTGMALPSLSALVDRWRVDQAISQLQNMMRFASAQAIRTNSHVVILGKPANCRSLRDTKNWSCGLIIFQDINDNHLQNTGEPSLQEISEFHALTVMHKGGSADHLTYNPYGVPVASEGSFTVSPSISPNSPAAQTICLTVGGRIRVQAGLKCSG